MFAGLGAFHTVGQTLFEQYGALLAYGRVKSEKRPGAERDGVVVS